MKTGKGWSHLIDSPLAEAQCRAAITSIEALARYFRILVGDPRWKYTAKKVSLEWTRVSPS